MSIAIHNSPAFNHVTDAAFKDVNTLQQHSQARPALTNATHNPNSFSSRLVSLQAQIAKTKVTSFNSNATGSIQELRAFIKTHANGTGRQRAFDGLELFEKKSSNLLVGPNTRALQAKNRERLSHFTLLLSDPSIDMSLKKTAATELCGSLGVCEEGESLHIEEQIAELSAPKDMSEHVIKIKNQLIGQNILAVVQHAGNELNLPIYKKMEIHHEQSLHNMFSNEWGTTFRKDGNINPNFVDAAGDLARSVLQKTITPAAIARELTDQLHEACSIHASTTEWAPYDQGALDNLKLALQHNYGEKISLHDVLELSDDSMQMRVQSKTAIFKLVTEQLKEMGLVPQSTSMAELISEPRTSAQAAISEHAHLLKPMLRPYQGIAGNTALLNAMLNENDDKKNKSNSSATLTPYVSSLVSGVLTAIDQHAQDKKKETDQSAK